MQIHALTHSLLLTDKPMKNEKHGEARRQEAQISPRDRAMRCFSWNLANCHATVQKLLVRQVLNKSKLWSWRVNVGRWERRYGPSRLRVNDDDHDDIPRKQRHQYHHSLSCKATQFSKMLLFVKLFIFMEMQSTYFWKCWLRLPLGTTHGTHWHILYSIHQRSQYNRMSLGQTWIGDKSLIFVLHIRFLDSTLFYLHLFNFLFTSLPRIISFLWFTVASVKKLYESVDNHTITACTKEAHLLSSTVIFVVSILY